MNGNLTNPRLSLLLLTLACGLITVIAVNTGYYYNYLFTPYCLLSWNCWLESLVSVFAQASLWIVLVDGLFLIYLLLKTPRFLTTRLITALLISASLVSIYLEALYLLSMGFVKPSIVGVVGGGIAALAGLLVYMGDFWDEVIIHYSRRPRVVRMPLLIVSLVLYFALRSYLSIVSSTRRVVYQLFSLVAGFSTGYSVGLLSKRIRGGKSRYSRYIGIVLSVATILYTVLPFTSVVSYTWSKYVDTVLLYINRECSMYYNLYHGVFEGLVGIKNQFIVLHPLESAHYELSYINKTRSVEKQCIVYIATSKAFNRYSIISITLITLLLIAFYSHVLYKSVKQRGID